jgi:hypothetical protein
MAKVFDHQVHHYDKTGKVIRANPYRMAVDGGRKSYERPIGSGMWYNEADELVKDDSAAVKAKQQAAEAKLAAEAEAARLAERAALKAELAAELEAEARLKKGGNNGISSKI